jgi:hypothetical protein
MAPASLDIQAASVNLIDSPAHLRSSGDPNSRLVFALLGGDVACLGAAIITANANWEANTITLETRTYTLRAGDNDTDGPNSRRDPRGDPEPGQLRCHPSGSHEPRVWA